MGCSQRLVSLAAGSVVAMLGNIVQAVYQFLVTNVTTAAS